MIYNAKSDIGGTISAFNYRKKITINHSGALTSYQVKLAIDHVNTNMKTDFGDIRFNTEAGNYIPYWIETQVNDTSADVWIKTNLVDGNTIIYMYYGNSNLTSVSDWTGTFPDIFTETWQEGGAVTHSDNVLNSGITTDGGHSGTNYTSWLAMSRGLGNDAIGSTTRYMIKFNINPYVKSPSIVTSANLTLTFYTYYWGSWTARLHRTITTYTDETVPTWNNFSTQSNWDATISASTASPGSGNPLIFTGFHALVTQLVNGTYTNNGFYLKTNELGGDREAVYYSSDAVTAANRPKLTLTWQGPKYTATEPTYLTSAEQTIAATYMSIIPRESPCRVGTCIVDMHVTWTNTGESVMFTPSIIVDSNTYSLSPVALSTGDTIIDFELSGLAAGTHSICPDPN